MKFTFPDTRYYNIELAGDNVDTKMSILDYQTNPIVVDKVGVGKDKITIKGIQGKTITVNVNIKTVLRAEQYSQSTKCVR